MKFSCVAPTELYSLGYSYRRADARRYKYIEPLALFGSLDCLDHTSRYKCIEPPALTVSLDCSYRRVHTRRYTYIEPMALIGSHTSKASARRYVCNSGRKPGEKSHPHKTKLQRSDIN